MTWIVKVIDCETGEVVKEIQANNDLAAERIEDDLYINLNHDRFYTTCEEEKS
jgi:uncharacterized FlaG/YvyC family protein